MPKTKKKIKKWQEVEPDPLYQRVKVAKFINHIMRKGKKELARRILYETFGIIEKKAKKEPLEVFDLALKNVAPVMEVRPRRIGGATYQVPMRVRPERSESLAMRWIIEAAKAGKGSPMEERLAKELMEAAENKGTAVKRKVDMHRMAEANRAFAHFAW